MHPSKVAAIWIGGVLIAALAYAVGPEQFLFNAWQFAATFEANLTRFVSGLADVSFGVLKALAIGFYTVFVVLAVLAIGRGLRGRGALVIVSIVYFLAIGWSYDGYSRKGWLFAFILALLGAVSMTRRLTRTTLVPATPWRGD